MKLAIYDAFVHELSRHYIRKQNKVFDVGCGDGFHTSILKKYSNHVIGGDLDNRTNKKYKINFRKISINDYGRKEEFDVAASFDVIEHVEDDLAYLKEIVKITKPGGLIIIGTPNRNRLSNIIISLFKGKIKYPRKLGYHYESGGDILHLREYLKKDLESLASKIKGIEVVKTYSGFLGLYVPKLEAVGWKKLDVGILKNYCQHLFIVLRKKS